MGLKQGILNLSTLVLSVCTIIHPALTIKSVLVLGYGDNDIHFKFDTFKSFYKCLCNTVMTQCSVDTNLALGPRFDIEDANYNYSSGQVCSRAKRCKILNSQMINQTFYTIECGCFDKITACQHRMTLLFYLNQTNDTCTSPNVEIGWELGEHNITIKQVDDRNLKLETCRTDASTESKNLTLNRNDLTNKSNSNYAIISSIYCFLLIVIILGSIFIYKSKVGNIWCTKETHVRAEREDYYHNCTVQYCNIPKFSTTLNSENHSLNVVKETDPIHSVQQSSTTTVRDNFQEPGDALFNICTKSNKDIHHLRNTLLNVKSSVHQFRHHPKHFPHQRDLNSSAYADATLEIFTRFNGNDTRFPRDELDSNPVSQTRNATKTKPQPCIKICPTFDDQGYTIVDASETLLYDSEVTIDVNRTRSNTKQINNEVSANHRSKGVSNKKNKSNQAWWERALPEIPGLSIDPTHENDDSINSSVCQCDVYEIPIIKRVPDFRNKEPLKESKTNGVLNNNTYVVLLSEDYEIPAVNCRPVGKTFSENQKFECVSMFSHGASEMSSNEENTQLQCVERHTLLDEITQEVDFTETNERGERNTFDTMKNNSGGGSENEVFSKLRTSTRRRKNAYSKCLPLCLPGENFNSEMEPTLVMQSLTQIINESCDENFESHELCKYEILSNVTVATESEDVSQDVKENPEVIKVGKDEAQQMFERRNACARTYYVLELEGD